MAFWDFPFFFNSAEIDVDSYDIGTLSEGQRHALEADSFWCFSKLMDGIQDNYTFAQPGIQKRVQALKDLISRIDREFCCCYLDNVLL